MTRKRLIILVVALLLIALGIPWILMKRQETEALAWAKVGRGALATFKDVAKALQHGNISELEPYLDSELRQNHPAPLASTSILDETDLTILRWQESPSKSSSLAFFESLIAPYTSLKSVKLKLASIESTTDHEAHVKALLWLRGTWQDDRAVQTHLEFHMLLRERQTAWHIAKIAFLKGQTTLGNRQSFAEIAQDRGLDFVAHRNPLFDLPEWDPTRFGIFKYSSAGISATDFNNDGHEDIFFADGAGIALYRNLGDGHFKDTTAQAGLPQNLPGYNVGLFVDFDNDGHQDLFLGGLTNPSRFFRNRGNGTFEEMIIENLTIDPLVTVAAAADYDLDGDLDLYFGRYLDPRKDLPVTLFYTRNSAGNTLLRNDGNFKFVDVTEQAGVREGGLTLGVAWADYDEDGDPDIYIANDFGRNALLQNQGDGTFKDVTKDSGTLDFGFGMSAAFGDVNGDGRLDLYISNVRSSQRWYGQTATLYKYLGNSVKQGTFFEDWPVYQEIVDLAGDNWRNYGDFMVKGNSLFLNQGQGKFEDISEQANANPLGWYWASNFFDYNNDGHLDVYAANGWITGHVKDDL